MAINNIGGNLNLTPGMIRELDVSSILADIERRRFIVVIKKTEKELIDLLQKGQLPLSDRVTQLENSRHESIARYAFIEMAHKMIGAPITGELIGRLVYNTNTYLASRDAGVKIELIDDEAEIIEPPIVRKCKRVEALQYGR